MNNTDKETLQIQKFIDAFANFYGEENRKLIESKLNMVQFIYVDSLVEKKKGVDRVKYDEEVEKAIVTAVKGLNIKGNVQDYIEEVSEGLSPSISPFCTEENGQLVGKILFILPKGEKLDDSTILHELNHVLSSSFTKRENGGLDFVTGFERLCFDSSGTKFLHENITKEGNRRTEWFNEILNEYIATLVRKQMKEKVFGSNFECGYSKAFSVMQDFLDTYAKDIAISELNDSQNDIVKMIGSDNLYDLNDKINSFMSFSDFSRFDLTNSIRKKLGEFENIGQEQILKRLDEISALSLTERERTYVNSISNLNSLSKELAMKKQAIEKE